MARVLVLAAGASLLRGTSAFVTWGTQRPMISAAGSGYGTFVAITQDGTNLAVGASDRAGYTGAAYMYVCTATACSLGDSNFGANPNDYFGISVAVSTRSASAVLLAVGAMGVSTFRGAVSVFTCVPTTGVCGAPKVILDPGKTDYDHFGYSVALGASVLAVGADGDSAYAGAVYTYTCSTASPPVCTSRSVLSPTAAGRTFGWSVSLSAAGTLLAVGASCSGATTCKGAAYTYPCSGGVCSASGQSVVTASDGVAGDLFGDSVSLAGDGSLLAVGAWRKGTDHGAVYIYVCTPGVTCTDATKKLINGPGANWRYGYAVALSYDGSLLAVGAVQLSTKGNVFTYECSNAGVCTGAQQITPTYSQAAIGDRFGYGLSIPMDGSPLVVAAETGDTVCLVFAVASNSGTPTQTVSQVPTPSTTPSITSSQDETPTQTSSASQTQSGSRTTTPSQTRSRSQTISRTASLTPSLTRSPSQTVTPGLTRTATPTSQSPSQLGTPSLTATSSASSTQTGTSSPTPSFSGTQLATPSATATASTTGTGTQAGSPSPTRTTTATASSSPSTSQSVSQSASQSESQLPSLSPSGSGSASQTVSESQSASLSASHSLSSSGTPSFSQTRTQTLTSSNAATPSRSGSLTATPSSTRSPSLTLTQSLSPSVTRTPTSTQSASQAATSSASLSQSSSQAATSSSSRSSSQTCSGTASLTPSLTRSPSQSVTSGLTPSATPSQSPSQIGTPSQSSTPSSSSTPSLSQIPTPTPSIAATPSQTETISQRVTPTKTSSASQTRSPSSSATATMGQPATSSQSTSASQQLSESSSGSATASQTLSRLPSTSLPPLQTSSASPTPSPAPALPASGSASEAATASFSPSPTQSQAAATSSSPPSSSPSPLAASSTSSPGPSASASASAAASLLPFALSLLTQGSGGQPVPVVRISDAAAPVLLALVMLGACPAALMRLQVSCAVAGGGSGAFLSVLPLGPVDVACDPARPGVALPHTLALGLRFEAACSPGATLVCDVVDSASGLRVAAAGFPVEEVAAHWPVWDDAVLVTPSGLMRSSRSGAVLNGTAALLRACSQLGSGGVSACTLASAWGDPAAVLLATQAVWAPVALPDAVLWGASYSMTLTGASTVVLRASPPAAWSASTTLVLAGSAPLPVLAQSPDGLWTVVATPSSRALCGASASAPPLECGHVSLRAANSVSEALVCPPFCPGAVLGDARAPFLPGPPTAGTAAGPVLASMPPEGSNSLPAPLPASAAAGFTGIYYAAACSRGGLYPDPALGACANASDPAARSCAWGAGDACRPCPFDDALCPGGFRLWPLEGRWVPDESAGAVLRCPPPFAERCSGWNASASAAQCGVGYMQGSFLCGVCAAGYFEDAGGACQRCPALDTPWKRYSGLVFALAAVAALCLAVYAVLTVALQTRGGTLTGGVFRASNLACWAWMCLQVLSDVAVVPSGTMQPLVVTLYQYAASLQFQDIALPPACTGAPPFQGEIATMAVAVAVWATAVAVYYCARTPTARLAGQYVLALAMLLYPNVSATVAGLLDCAHVTVSAAAAASLDGGPSSGAAGSGAVVSVYVNVPRPFFVCWAGSHAAAGALAAVAGLLFVAGMPLITLCWLRTDPWLRRVAPRRRASDTPSPALPIGSGDPHALPIAVDGVALPSFAISNPMRKRMSAAPSQADVARSPRRAPPSPAGAASDVGPSFSGANPLHELGIELVRLPNIASRGPGPGVAARPTPPPLPGIVRNPMRRALGARRDASTRAAISPEPAPEEVLTALAPWRANPLFKSKSEPTPSPAANADVGGGVAAAVTRPVAAAVSDKASDAPTAGAVVQPASGDAEADPFLGVFFYDYKASAWYAKHLDLFLLFVLSLTRALIPRPLTATAILGKLLGVSLVLIAACMHVLWARPFLEANAWMGHVRTLLLVDALLCTLLNAGVSSVDAGLLSSGSVALGVGMYALVVLWGVTLVVLVAGFGYHVFKDAALEQHAMALKAKSLDVSVAAVPVAAAVVCHPRPATARAESRLAVLASRESQTASFKSAGESIVCEQGSAPALETHPPESVFQRSGLQWSLFMLSAQSNRSLVFSAVRTRDEVDGAVRRHSTRA